MKLFTKTPRTTADIVASFDKTLTELKERVAYDDRELEQIEKERTEALRQYQERLEILDEDRVAFSASRERANRIIGKIAELIS